VFIPLTRLCRDRCGYCTFATVPGRLESLYLSPDEVLDIARQGAALGCKEAASSRSATGPGGPLEGRAREWLDAHGYEDTLSYVRARWRIRVLEETGPGCRTSTRAVMTLAGLPAPSSPGPPRPWA